MPTNVQEIIQSLVRSSYLHDQADARRPPTKPVVTISRDLGAGGSEIARRIAAALGIDVWDRAILDAIAESAKSDPELMAKLDDKVGTGKDTWIYNLLSGQNAFMSSYRHHLVNVVLALAQQGGVIIGRGAHLILANRPAFRLRIVGSLDACARRLSARESMDFEKAKSEVKRVNKERDQFLQSAFRHHLDESERFDLIVNTDRFNDRWDEVVGLILNAVELTGLGKRK